MLNMDNYTSDSRWILKFPVWIIENSWKLIPVLDQDWHIETDIEKISKHVDAIIRSVEPDTLSLINIWFWNQIEELSTRVDRLLKDLVKYN